MADINRNNKYWLMNWKWLLNETAWLHLSVTQQYCSFLPSTVDVSYVNDSHDCTQDLTTISYVPTCQNVFFERIRKTNN